MPQSSGYSVERDDNDTAAVEPPSKRGKRDHNTTPSDNSDVVSVAKDLLIVWTGEEVHTMINEEANESETRHHELCKKMIHGLDRIMTCVKRATDVVQSLRDDLMLVESEEWDHILIQQQRDHLRSCQSAYKSLLQQLIDSGDGDIAEERNLMPASVACDNTTTATTSSSSSSSSSRSGSRDNSAVASTAAGGAVTFIKNDENELQRETGAQVLRGNSFMNRPRSSNSATDHHVSARGGASEKQYALGVEIHSTYSRSQPSQSYVDLPPADPRLPVPTAPSVHSHLHMRHTQTVHHTQPMQTQRSTTGPSTECCACKGQLWGHPCTMKCALCRNICHEECSKKFVRFTNTVDSKRTGFICSDSSHVWRLVDSSLALRDAPIEALNRWQLEVLPSESSKVHAKTLDFERDLLPWPSDLSHSITCNLCGRSVHPSNFEKHTGMADVRKNLQKLGLLQNHVTNDIDENPEWLAAYRYSSFLVLTLNAQSSDNISNHIKDRIDRTSRELLKRNTVSVMYIHAWSLRYKIGNWK